MIRPAGGREGGGARPRARCARRARPAVGFALWGCVLAAFCLGYALLLYGVGAAYGGP